MGKNGNGHDSWLTIYFSAWKHAYGPDADFTWQVGPAVKVLQQLETKHGPQKVLKQFSQYLAVTNPGYISWPKFASAFGTWGDWRWQERAERAAASRPEPPNCKQVFAKWERT